MEENLNMVADRHGDETLTGELRDETLTGKLPDETPTGELEKPGPWSSGVSLSSKPPHAASLDSDETGKTGILEFRRAFHQNRRTRHRSIRMKP